MISASDDYSIKIWSPDGSLKNTLLSHSNAVNGLAILKNGDIVSASNDKTVKIWDENGQLKNTFEYHFDNSCFTAVQSVASLPNGYIASASSSGRIIISDTNGNVKCNFFSHDRYKSIWGLVVLPNGQLVSSSEDKLIKILA